MITTFKKLNNLQQLSDVDRVQDNIKLFSDQLVDIPILNGQLIENVALTTSAVLVNHKLGRAYRGWIVVDQSANASVYSTTTTLPTRFISLVASNTVTVSLWVF